MDWLAGGISECDEQCVGNEEAIREMVERQKDMRIPKELLPVCPHCGKPMTMNLHQISILADDCGESEGDLCLCQLWGSCCAEGNPRQICLYQW